MDSVTAAKTVQRVGGGGAAPAKGGASGGLPDPR